MFLPLSVSPARPRRTFGYTIGWSFSLSGFRRFPFCCYRLPGYRRIPFTFTPFLSFPFPGFCPTFPFFLSLGCECQLTHWSPGLGQRVVPPNVGSIPLQWSPDLEDHSPFYKRRRLYPFYCPFRRSITGTSFPVQVFGCSRKQAHAC